MPILGLAQWQAGCSDVGEGATVSVGGRSQQMVGAPTRDDDALARRGKGLDGKNVLTAPGNGRRRQEHVWRRSGRERCPGECGSQHRSERQGGLWQCPCSCCKCAAVYIAVSGNAPKSGGAHAGAPDSAAAAGDAAVAQGPVAGSTVERLPARKRAASKPESQHVRIACSPAAAVAPAPSWAGVMPYCVCPLEVALGPEMTRELCLNCSARVVVGAEGQWSDCRGDPCVYRGRKRLPLAHKSPRAVLRVRLRARACSPRRPQCR